MRRGRHWLAATCAAIALTAAACGGSSGGGGSNSPSGDVLSAIDALGGAQTLTTTVRLDATASSLQAMAHAGNATLKSSDAAAITGASIVIETTRSGGKTNVDLRVLEGSNALIELRTVNDSLYLQGNLRGILTLFHKEAVFANLRAQTKSMPSFVQAAINGRWVSLPAAALSSLAQAGGSGTAGSSAKGIKLLGELHDLIKRDVTVKAAGSDSRGERYSLTADQKALARDVQAAIADSVPGGALLTQRLPTSTVKHRTIHVDAWVSDGALADLSIDLAQFGDPGTVPAGTTLPLTISFQRSGAPIAAPTGAVPVDLTQLGTLVGALSGGGSA